MFVRKLLLLKSSFGKTTKSQINNYQGLFKKVPTSFLWPMFLSNHSSRTLSFSVFPTPHFPFSSTSSTLPQSSIQRDWQDDLTLFLEDNEWALEDIETVRHVLTQYSACQDISTLPQEKLKSLQNIFICFGIYFTNSERGYQYMEESIRVSELFQDPSLAQVYLYRFLLSYHGRRFDDLEIWLEKAESAFLKHPLETDETPYLDLGLKVARILVFLQAKRIGEVLSLAQEVISEEDRILQSRYALYYSAILQELAEHYFTKGERKKAVEFCRRILEKTTPILPREEGSVNQIVRLAQILYENEEYSEAEFFANLAKNRFQEVLPKTSFEVAFCEKILGHVYEDLKDFDRSWMNFEKARKTLEEFYPEETGKLEEIYLGLANVYFWMLENQRSAEAFNKFLGLRRGKENLEMIDAILVYCNLLNERNETRKNAQDLLEIAFDLYMNLSEKDYQTEHTLRYFYGTILKLEGNHAKANEILESTEELMKKLPNLSPTIIGEVFFLRGGVALELGDLNKSLDLFEKVMQVPGLNDPKIKIEACDEMLVVYQKLGQPKRGSETLLSLLELYAEVFGKKEIRTVEFLNAIEGFFVEHKMEERLPEIRERYEKM